MFAKLESRQVSVAPPLCSRLQESPGLDFLDTVLRRPLAHRGRWGSALPDVKGGI